MNRIPRLLLFIMLVLILFGCGEADDGDATGASPSGSEATASSTTSTVVAETTTSSTVAPTTSQVDPGPVAPLNGLPVGDGADLDRPALVVKIDNHPKARPQIGLQDADLVFDLRAEGVTRFMAVFHSTLPDAVGPVRSSRTSDFDLVRGLDNPLYASSGGNDYVMNGIRSLPVYELTNQSRSEYYRDSSRPAPHNLFIDPTVLYTILGDAWADDGNPEPWFGYRGADDVLPATAEAAVGPVTIDFTNSPTVTFEWDGAAGWLRSQDGVAHTTADGQQLAPENVVILVTSYRTSAADAGSPEVVSTGSGDALVLTDGSLISGSWSRPDPTLPPELLDDDGNPISLTPGQTWILYPEAGQITS